MITIYVGTPPNLPWWKLQSMSDEEILKFNCSYMVEVRMDDKQKAIYQQLEGRINTAQSMMLECIELIYNGGYNQAIEDMANIIDNNKGVTFTADEIRKFKK